MRSSRSIPQDDTKATPPWRGLEIETKIRYFSISFLYKGPKGCPVLLFVIPFSPCGFCLCLELSRRRGWLLLQMLRTRLMSRASPYETHATIFCLISSDTSIQLRTHSLVQPYLDSDLQSRWWDFGGDTIIRADKHIRLSSDRPSQSGWIYSRVPLTATNWEIEVEFDINGQGNLFGDGFAMWVTTDRAQQGPVFGNKDKFEGLGIFFDTYKNNRPGVVFPYVMAMLGDGHTAYDQAHDGKANELAGCSVRSSSLYPLTLPTNILLQGTRSPQRKHPHQSPRNLLRRKILEGRTHVQKRRRMDSLLRRPGHQVARRDLPRFLR
jgi:hypothetical protein